MMYDSVIQTCFISQNQDWRRACGLAVVDFNVLVAETDAEADVAVPVAEWMSDIRTPLEMTSGSKKACLLFDLYPYKDVFHNVRFEMIYRTVDVETVNKKLLFSISNDGVTDRVKDVFEFSLDDDVSRYQVTAPSSPCNVQPARKPILSLS